VEMFASSSTRLLDPFEGSTVNELTENQTLLLKRVHLDGQGRLQV
jgi:hypothetical protein